MEDDGAGGRSRRYEFGGESTGLTLGGILSIKQTPPYRIHDRTLLDLIRDDQTCGKESKKTWKMFREKLRLKLAGSVCTTNFPTLASHVAVTTADSHRVTTRHGSVQQNSADESRRVNSPPLDNASSDRVTVTQASVVETEHPVEETSTEEGRGGGAEGEPAAARMSLMSLLEFDGSAYLDDDDQEKVEEEDVVVAEEGGGGGGGGYKYNNCCVCMVRHKGAAFIPCGHTFCRLCSRELFVQRASCPLCNNFILEILDIF